MMFQTMQQKADGSSKRGEQDVSTIMQQEAALEEARKFKPEGMCTQVMTPAIHVASGATYTFPSGCLPNGWEKSDSSTLSE